MNNLNLTSIIVIGVLFFGLCAFFATQLQIQLPYSQNTTTLADIIVDWIGEVAWPF